MNRDEAFELQLARWLEEGPFEAPDEPVAAALLHVRAHPQRRRSFGGLWRRTLSTIRLTHVPSRPHNRWALAAATAIVAIVVVGGGYGLLGLGQSDGPGGVGPSATPTAAPTASQVPTASPSSATPRPSPWTRPPGWATGTQTCRLRTEGTTATVAGVVESRGDLYECSNASSDPRLEGIATTTMNSDELRDGTWLGWGSVDLVNDAGAWHGTYAVTSTSTADSMAFDAVQLGTGDYDGLLVLNHVVIRSTLTTFDSIVLPRGPEITGTETCTSVSAGTYRLVGDVTATRGVVLRCTDEMSDARLSGTRVLDFAIDTRADDSADLWGTTVVQNDDGTWDGFWFGMTDPGGTTKRAHSLTRGTGAYEGLLFRLDVVGTGDPGYDLSGEIIAAG